MPVHTPARQTSTWTCPDCGSSDIWRIQQRSGVVAAIMRHYGRKPYQCRACGWLCYRGGRHDDDVSLGLRLLSHFASKR